MAKGHSRSGEADPYDLLKVTRSATAVEIRRSYQELARKFHPDRIGRDVSESERAAATGRFQQINWAYELLTSSESRKEYDTETVASDVTQEWPISATVDLDSMDYDPQTGTYFTDCRCGGSYNLTETEMEKTAVDTVCCSTCTLAIRVLYHQLDDSAHDQNDL